MDTKKMVIESLLFFYITFECLLLILIIFYRQLILHLRYQEPIAQTWYGDKNILASNPG
jgi:phosphate starvation-inducible membrane PsiE